MKPRKNSKADPITAADPIPAVSYLSPAAKVEAFRVIKVLILDDAQKAALQPPGMVATLNYYAKCITKDLLRFRNRPDDRRLVGKYDRWHRVLEACDWLTSKHPEDWPALPPVPRLIGNDYYAGLIHLADFCAEVARRLWPVDVKAPAPAPTTVDRAADYITKHAGKDGCTTATVCKEACDGMEAPSFINHISPALRARGFHCTRGCTAAWYPPVKAGK